MSKNKLLANTILLFHLALVFIILFGWQFPKIKFLYLVSLLATLFSELFFGYCILTKWEFDLRRKADPALDYDYSFLSYYGHKMGIKISQKAIKYSALAFLLVSLIIFYVRTLFHS